jgi:hypothetical protein
MSFPDVDKALVYLLADLVGGLEHAGTETPSDLQNRLPYIRVGRVGGTSDEASDYPVVDVDYFSPLGSRDAAVDGAEAVRQRLTGSYHVVNGVVLDDVDCLTGPRELPWLGTGVRRFTGTYRVVTRNLY